jgi:hypothetical protein
MSGFQIIDLQDFDRFMIREGFESEATCGEYEVARYRKPDDSGTNQPVMVYRRKTPGIFTVWPNGNDFNYLIDGSNHRFERKSPQVVGIEAGKAVTSPAPAGDPPW